jgi:hypothetical protein
LTRRPSILVIRGKASDITEVERLVKVVSEKDRVPTRRATAKPLTLSFFFIQGLMGPENQPRSKPQSHRRMHQPDPRDEAVRAKLEKPVTLNANRESLETVLKQLCAAVDLDMVVKWRELEAVGISSDENIELALRAPETSDSSQGSAGTPVLEQLSDGDLDIKAGVRNGLLRVGPREGSLQRYLYTERLRRSRVRGHVVPRSRSRPRTVGYSCQKQAQRHGAFGGEPRNTQPGNESTISNGKSVHADRG